MSAERGGWDAGGVWGKEIALDLSAKSFSHTCISENTSSFVPLTLFPFPSSPPPPPPSPPLSMSFATLVDLPVLQLAGESEVCESVHPLFFLVDLEWIRTGGEGGISGGDSE